MKIAINTLKNAAMILLLSFAVFSVVRFTGYNKILNNNNSIMDYLDNQNTLLSVKIDSLQKLYLEKELSYIKLDSILDNRNKQLNKLKLENRDLQLKLANLENEMANISSDSSYNYLMHRYIPTQDSLRYAFAPNQVKSIHFDVLAFDYTKLINTNLEYQTRKLTDLYYTATNKFDICKDQKYILLDQVDLLSTKIKSLETMNNTYKKSIKNQKLKAGVFGVGALGILTYMIVNSAINN
jgi:hypothetical protein